MKFAVTVSGTVSKTESRYRFRTVSEGDFKTRFETRFQAAFPELISKRDFQLPCFTLNIGIEGTVNSSVVG